MEVFAVLGVMVPVFESKLFIAVVGLVGAWVVGNGLATRWQSDGQTK